MRLWLDDNCENQEVPERLTPDGWVGVKTAQEAIAIIATGVVTHIGLDHDLGDKNIVGEGYDVANFIEDAAFYGRIPRIIWSIQSSNGPGRKKMEMAMSNADSFWSRTENSA